MADFSNIEKKKLGQLYPNQHYDESLDLQDSEDVVSVYSPTPRNKVRPKLDQLNSSNDDGTIAFKDLIKNEKQISYLISRDQKHPKFGGGRPATEDSDENDSRHGPLAIVSDNDTRRKIHRRVEEEEGGEGGGEDDDEDNEEEDDEDDDDDDGGEYDSGIVGEDGNGGGGGGGMAMRNNSVTVVGAYKEADYDHLAVSSEVKELFQYITRYTPQSIDLEFLLKPFIPEYIPAVGDIDAFLKIPRHDGNSDSLGLTVLDEPCAKQSDSTVVDLMYRSLSKQNTTAPSKMTVKSIDNGPDAKKHLDSWIKNIADLHRSKPPPTVHFTRNMPEIDELMQEWPPQVEDALKEVVLPTSELECDLNQFVELVCALCDIPIYKSKIHSLYLLFMLYSEFRNSQHFQSHSERSSEERPPDRQMDIFKL